MLLLILLILGCGSNNTINSRFNQPSYNYYIDPFFNPYIQEYKDAAKRYGAPDGYWDELVRMEWSEPNALINQQKYGYCTISKYLSPINDKDIIINRFIVIDPNIPTQIQLKITIFHELTHCIYEVGHSDGPNDIMSTSAIFDDWYMELTWENRIKDMFMQVTQIWSRLGKLW